MSQQAPAPGPAAKTFELGERVLFGGSAAIVTSVSKTGVGLLVFTSALEVLDNGAAHTSAVLLTHGEAQQLQSVG